MEKKNKHLEMYKHLETPKIIEETIATGDVVFGTHE